MKKLYAIFIILSIVMMISKAALAQSTLYSNPIISNGNKMLLDHLDSIITSRIIGKTHFVPNAHPFSSRVLRKAKAEIINLSAGTLSVILTSNEKATITSLQLFGTIDARDFKTMRDSMPELSFVDIYNVSIPAYAGLQGSASNQTTIYPANTIPQKAFLLDHNLISIILPSYISSIGDSAFYSNGLTGNLTIPNTVTSIGNSAFESCWNLNGTLTIPNSVTSIGLKVFAGCQNLTGLTISNSLTSISDGAFAGDWSLSGVLTIPNSVTSIGDDAFGYCESLTGVSIPNSVTHIGNYAFSTCKGLTGNLIIPNFVTSINEGTFSRCANLTDITIPNSVTFIGNYAFTMSGLTSITIPNSVTSIGESAFVMCHLTGNVTIPNYVTTIGHGAFSLTGITEFVIENDNPTYSVAEGVLFNKNQTRLIMFPPSKQGIYTIPNSVTSIGFYAFDYCNGLTGITIPNTVASIDSCAFLDCEGLTSIYANSTIPINLNNSPKVFGYINKTTCTLFVPKGSENLYQTASQWMDFVNIIEMDPTGISELTDNKNLILYPNPVTDGFYINGGEKQANVSIYNINGKLLASKQVTIMCYIDMAALPKGQYIVKITTTKGIIEKKLIKK